MKWSCYFINIVCSITYLPGGLGGEVLHDKPVVGLAARGNSTPAPVAPSVTVASAGAVAASVAVAPIAATALAGHLHAHPAGERKRENVRGQTGRSRRDLPLGLT